MKLKTKIIASTIALATLFGGLGIMYADKCAEVSELQVKNQELGQEISQMDSILSNQFKELKKRDAILEEYRSYMDEQDAKIERLEKVEKQHKECPTREIAVSRGGSVRGTPVKITMTFYGDFPEENGGYPGIDAHGNKLVAGTVASNVYPQGTKFLFNGQTFTVKDRGGKNFNSYNRLDVFVPRLKGESDDAYARSISNYGRKTVTMYKL